MRDTPDLSAWLPCDRVGRKTLPGRYAICEPYLREAHSAGLFQALGGNQNTELWDFMPLGPFAARSELEAMLAFVNPAEHTESSWQTMVVRCTGSGEILGMASYMRIREAHGSAEVGAVTFSKKMQRTRIATEAMYLMARHVFADLGYRRYEWKCHHENAASMRAAVRFGFIYEGVFRNDMVVKGRNRDTAWYAITDSDWPLVDKAFTRWLAPSNFDPNGQQKSKLAVPGAG